MRRVNWLLIWWYCNLFLFLYIAGYMAAYLSGWVFDGP